MSESLFELHGEGQDGYESERGYPVTDTLINQIRAEFERLRIDHSMEHRREIIESATMHPVENLRELSAVEARRVLTQLRQRTGHARPATGLSWDSREEDTWIDKL